MASPAIPYSVPIRRRNLLSDSLKSVEEESSSTEGKNTLSASALSTVKIGVAISTANGDYSSYTISNERFDPSALQQQL